MRGKKKYYFNEETIQYLELKTDWRKKLRYYFGCLSLAAGLTLATQHEWIRIDEHFERKQQAEVLENLSQQFAELTEIETRLNRIHENDQSFYRSILNQEPISSAVWEGGMGGSEQVSATAHPVLRKTRMLMDKLLHKFKVQKESFASIREIANDKSEELKHIPAIKPLHGRIVSGFGYRPDPFHGHIHFHAGIDIVARIGQKIKASGDGVIITAGSPQMGYGLQVEIDHGYGYITKYAHLSGTNVQVGQKVKRGEIIGFAGNTGYSTGPHLHYEVMKNGGKVNPFDYFYSE